jgi:hypothetical protein
MQMISSCTSILIEAVAVVKLYEGMQDVLIAHGSMIDGINKVESTCPGWHWLVLAMLSLLSGQLNY